MKLLVSSIMLIFVITLLSCNKSSGDPNSKTNDDLGKASFTMDMSLAPADVTYLKGILSRSDHDTIFFDFIINNNSATASVENLITGTWNLTVNAYNSQDYIIYTGSTNVDVLAGLTTPVQLHLNPITGSIVVIVTWGNSNDYALDFDGIDDTAILMEPNSELRNISTEITMAGWIYVRSFPCTAPRIIDCSDNHNGAPTGDRFLLSIFSPLQCVSINVNGYTACSDSINLNQWIHVAGTYDGQMLKIYVNGTLEDSTYLQTTIDVKDSSLYVGNNSLNNRQFDGMINSLNIWDIALNAEQIQELRDYGVSGLQNDLISCWMFNENSGQIVYDNFGTNHMQLGSTLGVDDNDPLRILVQ